MSTFGIVMCLLSLAIYGMVVSFQIKRIDFLEAEQIRTTDRLNLYRHRLDFYRERYQSINACCVDLVRRIQQVERHPFFKPLQMTPVSDFQPGDIHPFTADAFVTTGDQLAEVA